MKKKNITNILKDKLKIIESKCNQFQILELKKVWKVGGVKNES